MHESEKWKWSHWVLSNSQRPHGLRPTGLLCPWDFPGKSAGVGCHCLLHKSYYNNPNQLSFYKLRFCLYDAIWKYNVGIQLLSRREGGSFFFFFTNTIFLAFRSFTNILWVAENNIGDTFPWKKMEEVTSFIRTEERAQGLSVQKCQLSPVASY